jgi:hypothetical protein
MWFKTFLWMNILLGLSVFGMAQQSLDSCHFHLKEFPVSYFFRVPQNLMEKGYENWSQEFGRVNGMITKAVSEEISASKIKRAPVFLRNFKKDRPDQLVMVHLNGRSRDPHDALYDYFAGHWLYLPGCLLTRDVKKGDTVLHVADSRLFRMNIQKKGKPVKHDHICMVPVNEHGEKLWEQAEQVKLKNIDHKRKVIVVERAQFGTKAGVYVAGSTYLAPHAHKGPFGQHLMWEYNMSLVCPRDQWGRTAADVFCQEILEWIGPGGQLETIDGIAFDVTDFDHHGTCKGRHVDVNNDGQGDDGYVDDKNVHGLGLYQFFSQLRKGAGSDFLLTADGHNPESQRAVGVLNGMESEGLCTHNDPFRAWSKTINYLNYWRCFTKSIPSFNYVAIKNVEEDPLFSSWSNERFGMGTATCLGVAYTESLNRQKNGTTSYLVKDETVAGQRHQKEWLGEPVGELQYHFVSKNGQIEDGLRWPSMSVMNAHREEKGNGVHLKREQSDKPVILELKDVPLPGSDLFFCVKVEIHDSANHYPANVPHPFYVTTKGQLKPEYNASRLYSLAGAEGIFESIFYIRNDQHQIVDIQLSFESGIDIRLEDFVIRFATPIMWREFQGGVVLVNPSVNPVKVDVSKLLPQVVLKRLSGTVLQKSLDPNLYNTGERINEPLMLSPVDALFLEKTN